MVLRKRNRRFYGFLALLGGGLVALSLMPGDPHSSESALSGLVTARSMAGTPDTVMSLDATPVPAETRIDAGVGSADRVPSYPAAQPKPVLTASVDKESRPASHAVVSDASLTSAQPASQPTLVADASPVSVTTIDASPASVTTIGPDEATAATPGPLAPGRIGNLDVNVRAGPSSSAASLFVANAGEPVKLGPMSRGWIRVITPDGASGWVYSRLVEAGPN